MVCIRNDLKVHTQELKFGSSDDTDPVYRSRFKAFNEQSDVEDNEFAITLRKEESLNRDNCTWLSLTGASSPSSCCKHYGLSGYMDLKIDAWFISLLSKQSSRSDTLFNTKITFFDGSRVNPIEEASFVLDQSKKPDEKIVFEENLEDEEVVLWLKNESECCSQTLDNRSKSKSKSKFAYLTDSSDEQSLFSSSSSSDHSSEVMDLEEISTDKPLFWPLNSASDWCSETKWDYFIMSPRKDIYKLGMSPKTTYNREPHSKQGCNRRLVFGTDSKSSSNMTSSANVAATEQEVDHLTKPSVSKHKIVLEDLLLVDKLNAEGVIEQVLGLGEFDGHEGIEDEFDEDDFSLRF
ncbi:hypothetical protein HanPI659440_Chr02g0092501 [Helianthus annuus]|nr:hypothetical protein HanPI659440_Chr02g0092501 [Helianthus annuus]